jgi:isoquinoline 1-oxidoreductase alpha subunit
MISLKVNGVSRQFNGDPNMPLLWYLRDELGLTGSKYGCGAGLCGACTVHIDGQATRGCVTPLASAEGKNITTIEGLDPNGNHPVQRAWRAVNVPQCGYCQSGQDIQAASR